MKNKVLSLIISYTSIQFFLLIFLISEANAKEIQKFKDWSAYSEGEARNKACMAVSKPIKHEGNYKRRGDIFLIVTHLPGQDKWDEFSVVAGYNFKPGSNPDIQIGDLKLQLFTSGSRAWSFSVRDDLKIINAMKTAIKMQVIGTSSRGTITTDTYSLLGFSKAYQAINVACQKK
ncbi:MAG: hypothetical protein CMM91_00685 [Rickettsiales bacterium]|nr:hypothetical protein [Rickettsiales bacterium]OUV54920.1 MAG: hypothetical protein CBC87_00190 [Rickettsiales bacterium TMED127]|tara:strand:+ start:12739 stop:13263 length:525 start_codon:yes stop_codon:yes gene_type:complete